MFKKIFLAISFLFIFSFLFNFGVSENKIQAAGLIESQIQSILNLLRSFSVSNNIISNVENALRGTSNEGEITESWCYTFEKDLSYGSMGSDVNALQNALTKEGLFNTSGIARQETQLGKFGDYTASAVVKFQEKYASEILIPWGLKNGTGYVGSATIEKLNNIYGCKDEESIQKSITLISPNGGEQWTEENIYKIKWNSIGVNKVDIEYGNGKSWYIARNYPAQSGEYLWTPREIISQHEGFVYPENLTEVKLNILVSDAEDGQVFDKSDNSFTLLKKDIATTTQEGSLSLSLASDSPATQDVIKGSAGQTFLKFKLIAGKQEDVKINSILVRAYKNNNGSLASILDISNIALYDGFNKIGNESHHGVATFSGLNLVIQKGTSKTITVKADIPLTSSASSLQLTIADGNRIKATGQSSNSSINVLGSATGKIMPIVSSGTLSLNSLPLPSTILSVGEKPILRFSLNAGKTEDMLLNKIEFSIEKKLNNGNIVNANGLEIDDFKLYELKTNNQIGTNYLMVNGKVSFQGLSENIEKGTTKTYELRAIIKKSDLCGLNTKVINSSAKGKTSQVLITPSGSANNWLEGNCLAEVKDTTCTEDLSCDYLLNNKLSVLKQYDTDKNGQINLSEYLAVINKYLYSNTTKDEFCSIQNAWKKSCNFATSINSSTVDWLKYTNKEYGFELKYPDIDDVLVIAQADGEREFLFGGVSCGITEAEEYYSRDRKFFPIEAAIPNPDYSKSYSREECDQLATRWVLHGRFCTSEKIPEYKDMCEDNHNEPGYHRYDIYVACTWPGETGRNQCTQLFNQIADTFRFFSTSTVNLISPSGGALLQGQQTTITWKTENYNGLIGLDLYQNDNFVLNIATNIYNNGHYNWSIPMNISGSGFKIKVVLLNTKAGSVYDFSDLPINIVASRPTVNVVYPIGGEKFSINSSITIQWENTNYRNSVVNIYLCKKDQSSSTCIFVDRIGNLAQENDGNETWIIPSTISPGDNYFIGVNLDVKEPESGLDSTYFSHAPFSITKNMVCQDINNVTYSGSIGEGGGIWPGYNWGYSYGTYYAGYGWQDNNQLNSKGYPLEIHYLGNSKYSINYEEGTLTFECDGVTRKAFLPGVSVPIGGGSRALYVAYDGSTYYDKNLTQQTQFGFLNIKNQMASISEAISQAISKIKNWVGK